MKHLLLVFLVFLSLHSLFAIDFSVDGINYSTTGTTTVAVVKGGSYTGNISIPQSISYSGVNYSVTSIAERAFERCQMASISIPVTVSSIGDYALAACPGLINVDTNNINYCSQDGVLYNKSMTVLIQCPTTKGGDFIVPSTVTTIGNGAFCLNQNIQGIILPTSVKTIGIAAFSDSYIKSIVIPSSVTVIAQSTFQNCGQLTNITLPSNITSIGAYAFFGCNKLEFPITIGSSVKTIGECTFGSCSAMLIVDGSNTNFSSKEGVLYNKTKTTLIVCPVSKTGSITIPSSVTSTSNWAFKGCDKLTEIILPSSLKTIGTHSFYWCKGLSSIDITSVTSIGEYAFSCSGLTNINIPETLTDFGTYAFALCLKLTSATVSSPVIGSGGLSNINITHIDIKPTVKTIGIGAFSGNYNLVSISIPSSVTSIKNGAFQSCGLKEVYVYWQTPLDLTNSGSVFSGMDKSLITLYVPLNTSNLYKTANQWKDFGNIVEMTTSIPQINKHSITAYIDVASSTLHINGLDDSAIIEMYNLQGRIIHSGTIEGGNSCSIFLKDRISAGVYLLRITIGNEKALVKIIL